MGVFKCRNCGLKKDVPDKYLDRKITCPRCAETVVIGPDELDPGKIYLSREQQEKAGAAEEKMSTSLHVQSGEEPEPQQEKLQDAGSHAQSPIYYPDGEGGVASVSKDETHAIADRLDSESLEMKKESLRQPVEKPVSSLLFGIANGVVLYFMCLAFTMVMFSNLLLAEYFSVGLWIVGLGALVASGVGALRSSLVSGIYGVEAVGAAAVALTVDHVYTSFVVGGYPVGDILPTITATIVCCSLGVGLSSGAIVLTGTARWLRFFPYQVAGGMGAALGILLMVLAAEKLPEIGWGPAGVVLSSMDVNTLCWGMSFCMAGLVFLLNRSCHRFLLLPLVLVAGASMSFVLGGVGYPDLFSKDSEFYLAAGGIWEWGILYGTGFWDRIQWEIISSHAGYIASVSIIVGASAVFRITAIENEMRRTVSIEDEYKTISVINFLAGLLGGMPGTISRIRSISADRFGISGKVAGLATAGTLAALLIYSNRIVLEIPLYIPVGLAWGLGATICARWGVEAWKGFSQRSDFVVLWIVFFITLLFGLSTGALFALATSLLMLVSRYGRVDIVKFTLSGSAMRSSVDRAPEQLAVLKSEGRSILILRLQGFIFLGTTARLLQHIQDSMAKAAEGDLRYVVLDLRLVHGLDSTIYSGFVRIRDVLENDGIALVLTSMPLELQRQFEQFGFADKNGSVRFFIDFDFALEWCEDQILEKHGMLNLEDRSLTDLLAPFFVDKKNVEELFKFLKRVTVLKGQYVFRKGDLSDSLYFVEKGTVSIMLPLTDKREFRLRKLGPGTVFGEMGIYTDAPRSASVVASEDCRLYKLSSDVLDILHEKDPHMASEVHRFLVSLMSARVLDANMRVTDLLK